MTTITLNIVQPSVVEKEFPLELGTVIELQKNNDSIAESFASQFNLQGSSATYFSHTHSNSRNWKSHFSKKQGGTNASPATKFEVFHKNGNITVAKLYWNSNTYAYLIMSPV